MLALSFLRAGHEEGRVWGGAGLAARRRSAVQRRPPGAAAVGGFDLR